MFIEESFAAGVEFPAYVEAKGEEGQKYAARYTAVAIAPEDEAFFRGIKSTVNIAAFSEIWCPDCVNNVPVVAKIAALNPNFRFRLFTRDSAVMEDYQTNGRRTIPTVVLMDADFKEIGRWVEHPQVVKERFAAGEDVWQGETREKYNRGEFVGEVIREVRGLLNPTK